MNVLPNIHTPDQCFTLSIQRLFGLPLDLLPTNPPSIQVLTISFNVIDKVQRRFIDYIRDRT